MAGTPFRDAYRQVGMEIEAGRFEFDGQLHHTHEGSIGNLCNAQIRDKMNRICDRFTFSEVNAALDSLLK